VRPPGLPHNAAPCSGAARGSLHASTTPNEFNCHRGSVPSLRRQWRDTDIVPAFGEGPRLARSAAPVRDGSLSTPFHKYTHAMKSMHFGSGQGANRSDTQRYHEDLQRRPGLKGAISCGRTCEMGY
jgi:hypothetical protein